MLDQETIWKSFNALQSANTTQQFLHKCYKELNVTDPEKRAFENCYPFIYYLEHGQNYYQLAKQATTSIKPVLLFYGMVQLLKACLLTVDPQYPESTSVLAHGVSTRKRKKQSYEFFQDEVKVQKNGLFTHFSERMFNVNHLEGEKFTMGVLLKKLPEMNNLFSLHYSEIVSVTIGGGKDQMLHFPVKLADHFHMTDRRFKDYILTSIPSPLLVDKGNEEKHEAFSFSISNTKRLTPLTCSPILYHFYDQSYYFPKDRDQVFHFPEIMVHYLLLYNLSMISRYETEWWSELLHSYSSNDYPFIQQFLSLTTDKVPYLVYLFLEEKIGFSF
ncbi:YaaC family protein [Bacillus sp. PS06]|uniref:YaaC family protein n=1 Tax=Bacillus sp. PS06 TaxID=2764176 RepID=UPI001CD83DAC|nr:YaaC family protein [Bacillus sp. PS06]